MAIAVTEVYMQRIVPSLWYDGEAEQAANFYVSLFPNSRIVNIARYGGAGAEVSGKPEGSVMAVSFELDGQAFLALNGGPAFRFTPAISFIVNCETQAELDRLWEKLSEGGATEQCGWLRDRYGVSWQIVPTALERLMTGDDPVRSERVMQAMLGMRKLDIEALTQAFRRA